MSKPRASLWLQGFLLAGLPAVCFAGSPSSEPSPGSGIQTMGYILSLVLLLGAAAVVLLRGGFWDPFNRVSKVARKLHVEEIRNLGHRQYLVVVEYQGSRMLLGVCPGRIDYLSQLHSDPAEQPEHSPAQASFQDLLSKEEKA